MANDSFIHIQCAICGDTDAGDMALSQLIFKPGFGSKHDGESVSLPLCGKCMDRLHNHYRSLAEKSAAQDNRGD